MSVIFTKTYSGTIKREISEGQFSPSPLPEYYIEQEKTKSIRTNNIETLFPSKIFNVIEKQKSIEITSNTLNIDITDVIIDGVPYTKRLTSLPSNISKIKEDFKVLNGVCYINTDKTYIQIDSNLYTVEPVVGLAPFNRTSNVSVKRLKDCFKITFKTNTPNSVYIKLNAPSIFLPSLINNWLIYHDCIYRISKPTYSYLSSHTFEYYDKQEIHELSDNIILRDIPTGPITIETVDRFIKVSYRTFRTNLMVNTSLSESLFIGVEEEGNSSLQVRPKLSSLTEYFINSVHTNKTEFRKIQENPYKASKAYEGRGESVLFVWELDSKYARSHNVPVGCERVLLSLNKVFKKEKKSIITPSYSLYDSTTLSSGDVYTTIPYNGTNINQLNKLLVVVNSLV